MVYSLTYRRPAHVSLPRSSVTGELKPKSLNESVCSGSTFIAHGIPDALAFDRIISGGTCPVSSSCRSCRFSSLEAHLLFRQISAQLHLVAHFLVSTSFEGSSSVYRVVSLQHSS